MREKQNLEYNIQPQQRNNNNNNNHNNHSSGAGKLITAGILLGLGGLVGGFVYMRYKVSLANEYIVKTGLGIENMQICKKTLVLPFQEYEYIDLSPKSYNFTLHAMSKEKMEFILPCVFTIGPQDKITSLENYAKNLMPKDDEHVAEIIKGMIEGETRSIAANMSIEDIFQGRTSFKTHIINSVQGELEQLGMSVFNANIKELQDSNESKYFKFLSQKVSADAENQAKVDISEARKRGEVGEKQREGEQRQKVIEIEANTKIYENEKLQEIAASEAQLAKIQAEQDLIKSIAKIEAEKASEKREEELQKQVEQYKMQREIEKIRAETLSSAKVNAEVQKENAQAESVYIQKIADAELYKKQREADSILYTQQKEAEGVYSLYDAQARGLHELIKSFNYDTKAALSYMMIEKDVYEKLAKQSANAIQGLNPKINVWNTGPAGKNNTFDTFHDLMKSIPPVLETVQDQTNIKLPDWLVKDENQGEIADKVKQLVQNNLNQDNLNQDDTNKTN